MTGTIPKETRSLLETAGQTHLLRWWGVLSESQRTQLLAQFAAIDFELLDNLVRAHRQRLDDQDGGDRNDGPRMLAERAGPPQNLLRLPQADTEQAAWNEAGRIGNELLAAGAVGAIVVAGGQGTRLKFDRAKGLFPIGPVSERSLFQVFAEQLRARSRRAGTAIPYFVMTSHATHDEVLAFFRANAHFGLNPADVFFFRQGTMPAVDPASGRVLLASKHEVAFSPDGHGGMPAAMLRAGLLHEMRRRGIEHLYYHQVDNPATLLCDPVFLGLHAQRNSDLSTKIVAKTAPEEPMGVVVSFDGKTRIIEYSDLPAPLLRKTDAAGAPCFWAGNTAIHAFRREFLERLAGEPDLLPFHVAFKAVDCLDESGRIVKPTSSNAWKFERFIFDALPHAERTLVVETDRAAEFLPVKKAEGADSPQSSREGLIRLYQSWLRVAGTDVAADVPVEISPLAALQGSDLRPGTPLPAKIDRPTVIGPEFFAENDSP
jgi:UDP-N-acetylglucosamine pyrophosphorylase